MELYKKHRPAALGRVVGQETTVKALEKMLASDTLPHSILFSGPSGVGKTTLARILKRELECSDADFNEMNAADFRGIDSIREIRTRVGAAPIGGACRIWLVDECHKLSNDAQNAFLKLLEDTPRHVYFILATTDPGKLIKTIRTRCAEFALKEVTADNLTKLMEYVARKERIETTEAVLDKIAETAEGSPRKALVLLDQIQNISGEAAQLKAVSDSCHEEQAINLARALFNKNATWPSVAAILKGMNDADPEGVRYLVLGYATTILLSGGPLSGQAFDVIDVFQDNFYDSKRAGLVAACYEVMARRKL